ncbi:MAG: helix-turn-helix transcriptional regulator [Rhizobiales bacterium]|nr:XRE family transcriptional regulator [Hyphomicrobiales bacterium]NRB13329.1 helix-turn-helix transcriptional regulator [Hyphomicrobiales bacterium]
MTKPLNNLDQRLSARLKQERILRGWSLSNLAEKSGVSRAMINKVERGQSSPTAALLGRLSGAFGLNLSTLLARAENIDNVGLIREVDQTRWVDPETGYIRTQVISRTDAKFPLDIAKIELPAGKSIAYKAASFMHHCQIIWVFSGRLTFIELDQTHLLQPGDVLQLGAAQDRIFSNDGAQICTYSVTGIRS